MGPPSTRSRKAAAGMLPFDQALDVPRRSEPKSIVTDKRSEHGGARLRRKKRSSRRHIPPFAPLASSAAGD